MTTEPRAWTRAARHRAAAPTRLGLTLRSVLVAPYDGFAAALRTAERRERAGERPAEGFAPYVLSLLGGAAAMALWLKLGVLVGRPRAGPAADLGLLGAALALGAAVSLAVQLLWGSVGPVVAARLGGAALGRDLRVAWGAAALPQVLGAAVSVPLDLQIAGPAAFGGAGFGDPVARAWTALSIALGLALAAWSAWLFVRGSQIASGLRLSTAVVLALVGLAVLAAVAAGLGAAGRLIVVAMS